MKLVSVLLALSLAAPAASWVKPVDGGVVRAFEPPMTRFSVGHVGVDFAATPGTPVRAAGPGTVAFAGDVAGSLHVTIAHGADLRTTYSFLADTKVRRGDQVQAGTIVGTSGGTGPNHRGDVVHLGLREGDTYLDPMVLFGRVDLADVVHLAPVADPLFRTETDERRSILDSVGGFVSDAGRAIADFGADAVDMLGTIVAPLADLLATYGSDALEKLWKVIEMNPVVHRGLLALAIARGTYQYVRELFHCDFHAPAANGEGGSGHRAMLVAGVNSKVKRAGGSSLGLDTEQLGYAADEVTYFSYSGAATYTKEDTWLPIIESAHKLGDQLKQMQRDEPGREVDLVAHSQGGVVVLTFLNLVYDPGDATYPPLGTVVTFASPLDGAPVATVLDELRHDPVGRLFTGGYDRTGFGPPSGGASTQDLAEGSDLMADLHDTQLPGVVDLTTIGGAHDLVVPGNRATTDGARHSLVVPLSLNAHTGLLSDDEALRAARSGLEARDSAPCRNPGTFILGELVAPTIEEYTYGFGDYLQELEGPLSLVPID